ncbi:BnaCnng61440D [Brassica napus]|uniref:BnaCnng61440D protein n=1 Tax=Brassica napus TaxID=3708 RepID=A0A078JQD8_BRANA|nr:BnaCnng61440D [Brassica napus]
MLEKQKDIVLVIANNEMPHIDSHSFYTSLLTKDIPLICKASSFLLLFCSFVYFKN